MFRFDPTGGGLLGARCVRLHSVRYIRFTFPIRLHFSVALPLPPFLYLSPVSSKGRDLSQLCPRLSLQLGTLRRCAFVA